MQTWKGVDPRSSCPCRTQVAGRKLPALRPGCHQCLWHAAVTAPALLGSQAAGQPVGEGARVLCTAPDQLGLSHHILCASHQGSMAMPALVNCPARPCQPWPAGGAERPRAGASTVQPTAAWTRCVGQLRCSVNFDATEASHLYSQIHHHDSCNHHQGGMVLPALLIWTAGARAPASPLHSQQRVLNECSFEAISIDRVLWRCCCLAPISLAPSLVDY